MNLPCLELLRRLDHISDQFSELREGVQKAVRIAAEDPEMALTRARKVLELIVRDVYERRCHEPPGTRPLENLLQRLVKDGYMPGRLDAYANTVRKLGNVGTHAFGERVTADDVYQSLTQLMPVLEWYFEQERPEALGKVSAKPATCAAKQPSLSIAKRVRLPRKRVWLAAAGGLAACVLVALLVTRFWKPERPAHTQVQPAEASGNIRVLALDVSHFANVQGGYDVPRGVLGKGSFDARSDDSVTVEARLSRPGYAYIVAYRPDGTEELCFPENENEAPPLTDRPRYPFVSRGVNYGLNEGDGLQVFAVIASSQPLPPYKEWRGNRDLGPWKEQTTTPGVVWRDNGSDVEALSADPGQQRGKGREIIGKGTVAGLTEWLRKAPQIDSVSALGFAVLPKAGGAVPAKKDKNKK